MFTTALTMEFICLLSAVVYEFWALIDGDVPTVLEKIGLLSNEEQEELYSCFGYNLKKKCKIPSFETFSHSLINPDTRSASRENGQEPQESTAS